MFLPGLPRPRSPWKVTWIQPRGNISDKQKQGSDAPCNGFRNFGKDGHIAMTLSVAKIPQMNSYRAAVPLRLIKASCEVSRPSDKWDSTADEWEREGWADLQVTGHAWPRASWTEASPPGVPLVPCGSYSHWMCAG